jgi:hypothetical protein
MPCQIQQACQISRLALLVLHYYFIIAARCFIAKLSRSRTLRRKPRDFRSEYHLPSMWRNSLRYWSWIPRAQHDRPRCEQSNTMGSSTDILHQHRRGKYAKLFSMNMGLQISISHPVGAGVGGRSKAFIWLEADVELTTTATHMIIDSHFHVWRIHSRCCLTIFMRPIPSFHRHCSHETREARATKFLACSHFQSVILAHSTCIDYITWFDFPPWGQREHIFSLDPPTSGVINGYCCCRFGQSPSHAQKQSAKCTRTDPSPRIRPNQGESLDVGRFPAAGGARRGRLTPSQCPTGICRFSLAGRGSGVEDGRKGGQCATSVANRCECTEILAPDVATAGSNQIERNSYWYQRSYIRRCFHLKRRWIVSVGHLWHHFVRAG